MRSAIIDAKRIVVKVGSSTLCYANGHLNLERIERLVRQLSDLANQGKEVILVSSGATGAGLAPLGFKEKPRDLVLKQAAAAVGQGILIHMYERMFREYGRTVGQVLSEMDGGDTLKHSMNNIDKLFPDHALQGGVQVIYSPNTATEHILMHVTKVPTALNTPSASTPTVENPDQKNISIMLDVIKKEAEYKQHLSFRKSEKFIDYFAVMKNVVEDNSTVKHSETITTNIKTEDSKNVEVLEKPKETKDTEKTEIIPENKVQISEEPKKEDLKQEVSSILKAQGLSYTSMLDALFRQIIKERRIPFVIALPTTSTDETPTPSTLNNDGTYEQPRITLKASDTTSSYGTSTTNEVEISFDKIDKTGILNIRINPKVKTLTTAILKEMGLTISQTVTLVSKQIQFAKDIPPTIHRPEWIDAINDDLWTKEEFNKRIEIGLNQAENGIGEPVEKVFNELLKDL